MTALAYHIVRCYIVRMAYDGIITYGITKELLSKIKLGKIDKIYQPGPEDIIIQVHTRGGNLKLLASCNSMSARLCLTTNKYDNPTAPPNFCMLLRKHLQGGRITDVRQPDSDRIVEIDVEAMTEMGFTTSRRLIFEVMGKHSNIILTDIESGKILDACKRVSIDVNRYRQTLPGTVYKYPPSQDKLPFKGITKNNVLGNSTKGILAKVSGISPAIAREISTAKNPAERLDEIVSTIDTLTFRPRIYSDGNSPIEFHLTDLSEYDGLDVKYYDSLSECVEYFFFHKESTNLLRQKSMPLHKNAKKLLDKAYLKKKRLNEDLISAEKSEKYKLWGELLTGNLHLLKGGENSITVTNWYNDGEITIPLDSKLSPSANAQRLFKKYNKSKTAKAEKQAQLKSTLRDIEYLESVLLTIEKADNVDDLAAIRAELEESGYIRPQNTKKTQGKKSTYKPHPLEYTLSSGYIALVGRNNRENDYLTTKLAKKTDLWLHTKDIPGSHVIVILPDNMSVSDLEADVIYEAASIAAFHSKASQGSNVPVDYVSVRHVKKPKSAKPGMVVFTDNRTVYVDPKEPGGAC